MADIPADTLVSLEKPGGSVPETPPGKKGPSFTQQRVPNDVQRRKCAPWLTIPTSGGNRWQSALNAGRVALEQMCNLTMSS